jgi:manganese/zinc/iron transport system permease protein
MMELFIEPWGWGAWMWRGLLASVLAAVPLAVLGVFLYLRRMSLIADALSHVALPGIVAAFLVTGSMEPLPMLGGAAVAGLATAWMIQMLSDQPGIKSDAAIGIVFTALFAIGVILLSTVVQDAHIDTQCLLFGNVLAISDRALWMLGIVAPVVLVLVAVFYRWLSVSSFDPRLAAGLGIPVAVVHYGLMTTVSITTVAAFESVGAILAIALMIVPAATAHLLADRLPTMIGISVLHSIISAVVGLYVSVWINGSTAGAIVVVGGVLYLLAFLFAPDHGRAVQAYRNWQRRKHAGKGDSTDAASKRALASAE